MIIVENLTKAFTLSRQQKREMGPEFSGKTVTAVDNVSFSCRPGRIFSLLGPNGAGKTTALRLIATMLQPTSGKITVGGFDAQKKPQDVRRRLGFLTGSTKLYDRLTPREVVKYYADLHGMDPMTFKRREEQLFHELGIDQYAGRRIGKLSTGMKQKVSIARTIIHDPEIVVFDEVTSGLDVIAARTIIDFIRRFRDENKTVLFSTHIMSEVSMLADDLAIIHKGRLCFDGTFADFQNHMQTPSLTDEFIRLIETV